MGSGGVTAYRVEDLSFSYGRTDRKALSHVSLSVEKGEVFGIVGGSGSGKTTLISLLCAVLTPPAGTVFFGENEDISALSPRRMREYCSKVQLVFQDPRSSFNPKKTVGRSLHAALSAGGMKERREREEVIAEAFSSMKLDVSLLSRFPHELSGGQRQRAAIARAISQKPDVLVLDEPVSALDVSVQAGVMNTLKDLFARRGMTVLLCAHDLAVVEYMTDRAAVLCGGKLAELAPSAQLFSTPRHPYTKKLVSAIPILKSALLKGDEK